MSATDRLFFALFPDATTAARVYALQQDLRVRHGLWGRPLAMDRLHVTLCHLGDYSSLPQAIVAKAREAAGELSTSPFEVTFDHAVTFAGRARNRPFVLRSKTGAASVEAFQRKLGAEMTMCGLGRFARPYTPHMTLLYDSADVAEHAIDPVTWTVTGFRLVHSLLGQTRHITLGEWRFGEVQAQESELRRAV
jgi:RNA 2',3'-cyclic 3'-phosphodiesterase